MKKKQQRIIIIKPSFSNQWEESKKCRICYTATAEMMRARCWLLFFWCDESCEDALVFSCKLAAPDEAAARYHTETQTQVHVFFFFIKDVLQLILGSPALLNDFSHPPLLYMLSRFFFSLQCCHTFLCIAVVVVDIRD